MSSLPKTNHLLDIFEDGLFVGNGELSASGELVDCHAPLNDRVLDLLEDAISTNQSSITVGGHNYSWAMTDLARPR